MARVPVSEGNGVDLVAAPTNAQTARATADGFGAMQARALQHLGGSIAFAADRIDDAVEIKREEERVRKARQASLELEDIFADELNADVSPVDGATGSGKRGFYLRAGAAAADSAEDTRKELESRINEYVSQYADDSKLQDRVRTIATERLRRELPVMARHAAVEHRKALVAVSDAAKGSAISRAVAGRNNPQEIGAALNSGFNAIDTQAAIMGLPPEVAEAQDLEFTTALHREVIRSFGADGQIQQATDYFVRNKGGIDPRVQADIKGEIQTYGRAASAEASRQRATAEAERKEYVRKTGDKFFGQLTENQLSPQDVMASDLPALGPGGKKEWLELIQQGAAGPQRTNPQVYNELFRRINLPEGDPQRISEGTDLNQYMPALGMSALNQLREEIGNRDPSVAELRKNLIRTARNTLSGSNDILGFRDPEGDAKFQLWLSDFLEAEKKAKGRDDYGPSFYDPKMADRYLGASIDSFKRTDGASLQDQLDAMDNDSPVVNVASPEEAAKLPSGTRFRTPDGRLRTRQ